VADDYEINLSSLHRHRIRPDVGDLRGRKNGYGPRRSTRAPLYFQRRVGFAIGSMSNQLPSSLVWSAAAALRMLIICALRKTARLVARSAMSSQCRFAGSIIAKFIAVATKPLGGRRLVSIRARRLASFG
jgi:hypothetical protein